MTKATKPRRAARRVQADVRQLGEVDATGRGFEIITFVDKYGEPCSLQQSSLAEFEPPGSSAVWLGCNNNSKPHHVTGETTSPRMHLDVKQVEALVAHLSRWLKTGSFKLPNPPLDRRSEAAER